MLYKNIKFGLLLISIFVSIFSFAQKETVISIHREQSEYYKSLNLTTTEQYDSLQGYDGKQIAVFPTDYTLSKRVFGYFPYWAGTNYLNYQWDLLSDFCYFSYEVDPSTGNPSTTHDWYSSDAIDMALDNGVNVHLCVTLFSGHYTFFNTPSAPQTLIDNIITMVQERGAKGVNIDFEAMPSAYGNAFTDFIIDLSEQMHSAIPQSEVSIAAPAVNWNNTFNIPVMKDYIDFFMVMGYDYYWNGSSMAGPVSPLYSMTASSSYNFSRTISYYQSQGVPEEQIVMGVPYYGRQWPTSNQFAPSATTGSGTAYTYRYIRNNTSGHYSNNNKYWEPNSFSPYFSFYTSGWNQCFMEDTYSLGKKYDIVNRRGLGGIGIWALGYDNGYTDFWELIAGRFTTSSPPIISDTIFDSGGPAFDYFNNEIYTYTISAPGDKQIDLVFDYLNLEANYDTLWIYDGPDINSTLIGFVSGNMTPGTITSTGNYLTLKFYSDGATTEPGWQAVYNAVNPTATEENDLIKPELNIRPNPFIDELNISFYLSVSSNVTVEMYDLQGRPVFRKSFGHLFAGENNLLILTKDIGIIKPGIYIIILKSGEGYSIKKVIH